MPVPNPPNLFWGLAITGMQDLRTYPGKSGGHSILKRCVAAGTISEAMVRLRKRGLLEKGSFQKSPFSRDSRDRRDSREPPDCGNKGESDHFLEIQRKILKQL